MSPELKNNFYIPKIDILEKVNLKIPIFFHLD